MKEKNLQNYVDIVDGNINKELEVITSIVYKYDIKKTIEELNTLSKEQQDEVLEMCINNYLTKIQNSTLTQEIYKKVDRDVDEIIDFYDDNTLDEVIEEASNVSYDLIMKVIGHNNRKIELPISIDYIKNFCINNMIQSNDIQYTIMFIVLTLSSVCYCLEHKQYNEDNKVK